MLFALVLGAVSGVAGFLPLIYGLHKAKNVTRTSNFGHASILLLSILASLVIIALTAFLCIVLARDVVMPFVIAEALALSATAIAFGVWTQVRK